MKWTDLPPFEDVQKCHIELGSKKAELKLLLSKIKLSTLSIKNNNPRKPWLIEQATIDEQNKVAELEADIASLEEQKNFYNYWKDMNRAQVYNNR